jgi:hypothetical protein
MLARHTAIFYTMEIVEVDDISDHHDVVTGEKVGEGVATAMW